MAIFNRRDALTVGAVAAAAPLAMLNACSTALPQAEPLLRDAPALAEAAPAAPREFRAAWVATVANIDWPSRKGLTSAQQQAEMHAMLDHAAALGLNAIILQVRTSADALYASALEPWSEYLTGTQGQAPEPPYDPLALWIAEAHRRGLELHAWFNPFRARQSKSQSRPSSQHVSVAHPEWVKTYGDQLWIDPGEPAAADHTLAVFADVLQRYDVDGIHIDDYFYPYPITQGDNPKMEVDFPDQPAWQRYLDAGGTLVRDDWRRNNVDALIERIYRSIGQTKPWVRFGISPFGLGRPELRPQDIRGFSQYHKLYADVERWLQEGWLDYLVPQLYWAIDTREQAFGVLLDYWHSQNVRNRHVWAGMFTSRIAATEDGSPKAWSPGEIINQVALVRDRAPESGHVHFSMVALHTNRQGVSDKLQMLSYQNPAVVPATPWLSAEPLGPVQVRLVALSPGHAQLSLLSTAIGWMRWIVWLRYGATWKLMVVSQDKVPLAMHADGEMLNALVVSGLDRVGNESPRRGYRVEGAL